MPPREEDKSIVVRKENFEYEPSRYYCNFNSANCSFSSINHKELEAHINKYHRFELNPYHCDLCECKYTTYSNLKTHIRQTHLNLKPSSPSCKYCGKKFKANYSSKLLEKHEKLHNSRISTNNNLYHCVISKCKDTFSSSISLKQHVRLAHEKNISKCLKCNLVYANEKSLKRHMKDSHCERNPAFQCKECSYIGRLPSDILLHMNKHSQEKNFKCNLCDAAYKTKSSLGFHMKKHSGENKYKCLRCSKSFRQPSLLRKHEETHSKIKLHSCQTCGTRFKQTYNLVYHEKYKCKGKLDLSHTEKHEMPESEIALIHNNIGSELTNLKFEEINDLNSISTSRTSEIDMLVTSEEILSENFGLIDPEGSAPWVLDTALFDEKMETFNIFDLVVGDDCSYEIV